MRRFGRVISVLFLATALGPAATPARAQTAPRKTPSTQPQFDFSPEKWDRAMLQVPDDDWKVIWPKLKRVHILRDTLLNTQARWIPSVMHDPNGDDRDLPPVALDAYKDNLDLYKAAFDPAASDTQLQTRLDALLDDRIRARKELAKAQKELRDVLEIRTEALLISQTMLEPATGDNPYQVPATRNAEPPAPADPPDPALVEQKYEKAMTDWRFNADVQIKNYRNYWKVSDDDWKKIEAPFRRVCMMKAALGDYNTRWTIPPTRATALAGIGRTIPPGPIEKVPDVPDFVMESIYARTRLFALLRKPDSSIDDIKVQLDVLRRTFPLIKAEFAKSMKVLRQNMTPREEASLVVLWQFDESLGAE